MSRVLWVCHFAPFPSTGHGALQRTHHIVKQVAKAHEVHLFILGEPQFSDEMISELGVQTVTFGGAPGNVTRFGQALRSLTSGESYWERIFFRSSLYEQLLAAAQTEPSILILDTGLLSAYAHGIPYRALIVNHHNVESALLEQRADRLSGWRSLFFSHQARKVARSEGMLGRVSNLQCVVSKEDEVRLRPLIGDGRVCVVPNGVDVGFFDMLQRETFQQDPFALVFAGGMDWYPNADAMDWLVTEIWPALIELDPRRRITIVGKSPPKRLVDLAEIDERVTVSGFVPDVRPYVHRASAYLCPIRQGGGTRLKVLDALALGCPLVATSLAVDGLDLIDGVHFLRADTAEEMGMAIGRLHEDSQLSNRLSAAGRAHVVEHFSWDQIGSRFAEIIAKL